MPMLVKEKRQCCCWTSYIKNGRVIPMRPLLVVGLPTASAPALLACLLPYDVHISRERFFNLAILASIVAAFSHLVSYSPLPKLHVQITVQ